MPIGDLSSRVSQEDRENTYNASHGGDTVPGFEGGDSRDSSDGGSGFDNLDSFGNLDTGGAGGSGGFDSLGSFDNSGDFGNFGNSGAGGLANFGAGSTYGEIANAGQIQAGPMQAGQQEQGPDVFDKFVDYSADSAVTITHIMADLIKSAGTRTLDDWALVGSRCMTVGAVACGGAVVGAVVGIFSGFEPLKFVNWPATTLMSGGLTVATGLGCLSSMILLKIKKGGFSEEENTGNINDIPDIDDTPAMAQEMDNSLDMTDTESNDMELNGEGDLSSTIDDIMAGIGFGDDNNTDTVEEKPEEVKKTPDELLENIKPEAVLNRSVLITSLIEFYPTNEKEFSKVTMIREDDPDQKVRDTYLNIKSLLERAIATACGLDKGAVTIRISEIKETLFSYIITFERDKIFAKKNVADLEEEIVNFFKSSSKDTTVSAKIETLAGDFICTINKGEKHIVLMGDVLSKDNVRQYFEDTHNRMPFVMGIDEDGQVILGDSKYYPSMLISGRARSGKSWYVDSWIMALATFNLPTEVQFLIIDPKESQLFKTIGLLPHVCGVHNHVHILEILHDIMDKELPRRKQLLSKYRCDTIWALRDIKHIDLPFLYIVMDEVMTIIKSLELLKKDKEFLSLLIQILTQAPSLGIGILIVPHRAQGVIDKTTRTQVQFKAAIRVENEIVKETLDITDWNRPLTQPGEVAIKTSDMMEPTYVRGIGIAKTDEDNTVLISEIARAFYKMGCEIPDMSSIGCGYNRDINHIKKELELTSSDSKVQFDIKDEDIKVTNVFGKYGDDTNTANGDNTNTANGDNSTGDTPSLTASSGYKEVPGNNIGFGNTSSVFGNSNDDSNIDDADNDIDIDDINNDNWDNDI